MPETIIFLRGAKGEKPEPEISDKEFEKKYGAKLDPKASAKQPAPSDKLNKSSASINNKTIPESIHDSYSGF